MILNGQIENNILLISTIKLLEIYENFSSIFKYTRRDSFVKLMKRVIGRVLFVISCSDFYDVFMNFSCKKDLKKRRKIRESVLMVNFLSISLYLLNSLQ